jgi:two-component system, sensor histidine kinase
MAQARKWPGMVEKRPARNLCHFLAGSELLVKISIGNHLLPGLARMLAAAIDRSARTSTRILLVEDHVEVAHAQKLLLKAIGYQVAVAHDGPTAVQMAKADIPDVCILDIGLPGLDGYEVAQLLQADPVTRGIRLIALTAYGSPDDHRRSRELGFERHLVKPATIDQLRAALA